MKKLLLIITLFYATSCKNESSKTTDNAPLSNQQRAEQVVTKYMYANLNDSASYQPISFTQLKPYDFPYSFTSEFISERDEAISKAKESEYNKVKHPCWVIAHDFRAKNGFGGTVKGTYNLILDSALTSVIYNSSTP